MVSHRRDGNRDIPCRACRRRIVRQKNQKDSRAEPNAKSDPKTSEDFTEESVAYAYAYGFAEKKESFSESIANRDAQEQIKAQKSISYSNTERIALGNRDSICQSSGNTRTCSRNEGMAERLSFAGSNRRLRE